MDQANIAPRVFCRKTRVVQGTLRQKAWRAMQIKGKFTLSDLLRNIVSQDNAGKDPRNNINRYVNALASVGILMEMKRRAAPASLTSNGEKRWMLIRDVGRKAPVARSLGHVYDPNSQTVIESVKKPEVSGE